MLARPLAAAVLIAAILPATASAESKKIGEFGSWTVFTLGEGAAKSCFAQSQPKSSEPKKAKRDPIFLILTDWPARHVKAEAEVTPGYAYKADSKVSVDVGSEKFSFFTRNSAGKGHAWVEAASDDSRLALALERGADVTVTGTSERGTKTTDVYSLNGLTAALKAAHEACGM